MKFTLDFGEVPAEVGAVEYKWTYNNWSFEINVGSENTKLPRPDKPGVYKVEMIQTTPIFVHTVEKLK